MTGDTRKPAQPEARAVCEHFYASHCYRGMSIRLCMTCGDPDWDDLAGQLRDARAPQDGQFLTIAFMGHVELTGYVTEITLGGEPGFHVDLPDRLWGGNPLAWEEYSAKVLFSRRPVTEESVRRAWESQRLRAAERARQEAEWRRMQEQRALTDGGDEDDYDRSPF